LLRPDQARAYGNEVRAAVLDLLDTVSPEIAFGDAAGGRAGPLVADLLGDGFVYGMVIQHEHQHDETMLAALQLLPGDGYRPVAPPPPPGRPIGAPEVLVDGGPFLMGTDTEPWAYDNERPAHRVHLPAYWIDTTPVTNAAYLEFVEDGGYDAPRWWTDAGWAWRQEARLEHPQFWRREATADWSRLRFGFREPLPPDEPVQHVCWYEADAYARWAGKRLPSEAEWEKAAAWDPAAGRARRHPWGDEAPRGTHANLGQRHFGPAPVGAYPAGASPCGALGMLGDVWEWTSSDFTAYPGFAAFPYREYSEVFFGADHNFGADYKVLRGGSWATHPTAARATFRNWDYPIRRQIFAGFRCARDA
jgi:iron(II)-dependent oxidoreductase